MSFYEKSKAGLLGLEGLAMIGEALRVYPATDTGWKRYGSGRELLAASVNHAANTSFELDTNEDGTADGVTLTGATAETTLSIVDGRLGGHAQRMVATFDGSPTDGYVALDSSAAATFAQGDVATFSAYIKGSAAGITIQPYVVVRDSSNSPINTSLGSAVTLTADWQRVTASRTCDVGADRARGGFYISALTAGDTIDLVMDDFQLEKGAITPYFNGSTPGCTWAGTVNASVSNRVISALIYTGLVSVDSAAATALDGQTIYSRASGAYRGPIVVAAAAYSAGEQAALAAAWSDPLALFRIIKAGDYLIPLNGDSVAYRKVVA